LDDRAQLMNRRLSKYVKLTGEQDLVLIGYSRGTTYALDMLAKAKAQNLPWLKNVKGMISLSGVTWGSTSADATVNPNAPIYHTVQAADQLFKTLQPLDDLGWYQWQARADRIVNNTKAWAEFFKTLREHSDPNAFSVQALKDSYEKGPLKAF